MSDAATKEKLESMGNEMVRSIKSGKNPKFVTLARTRSNIVYDPKIGYLKLGKTKEERDFVNVGQSKRFMQTVAIASKCHKFVKENLHTTIRGLFYQLKYSLGEDVDENIFSEQAESNPLIEDLEVALDTTREYLNLNSQAKPMSGQQFRNSFASPSFRWPQAQLGKFYKTRMSPMMTWRDCSSTGNRWNLSRHLSKQ